MKIFQYNKQTGEIIAVFSGTFNLAGQIDTDQVGHIDAAETTEAAMNYLVKDNKVVYRGPRPTMFHFWNGEEWELNEGEQQLILAEKVRNQRNQLLIESDWVVAKAYETQTTIPEQWVTYRQALRDIPQQNNFPVDVVFPEKPQ